MKKVQKKTTPKEVAPKGNNQSPTMNQGSESEDQRSILTKTIFESIFPLTPSKAQFRKIQIIQAALFTFASIDVNYFSYEDIARKAETSKNLIMHHFPDKEDLFEFLMLFVRSLFQKYVVEKMITARTSVEKLTLYSEACMDWFEEYPDQAKVLFLSHFFCAGNEKLKTKHCELTSMGQQRIASILEIGINEGLIQPGPTYGRSKNIQKIIMGGLTETLAEGIPSTKASIKKDVTEGVLLVAQVINN